MCFSVGICFFLSKQCLIIADLLRILDLLRVSFLASKIGLLCGGLSLILFVLRIDFFLAFISFDLIGCPFHLNILSLLCCVLLHQLFVLVRFIDLVSLYSFDQLLLIESIFLAKLASDPESFDH